MRIAVIGAGHIGGTLGTKWEAAGHEVSYGARTPSSDGPAGAQVRTVADALRGADVVLLAVPGGAAREVVADNAAGLAGKTVIDATNSSSGGEFNSRAAIAETAPEASYARAFNSLGWENYADPLDGAELLFAADLDARPVVEELIKVIGLKPVYVGDADAATAVDGLLPLWLALVRQSGGNRRLAFRVLR